MELKYPIIAIVGSILATVLLLVFVVRFFVKDKAKKGIKIANTELIFNDSYMKRRMMFYYVLRVLLVASLLGSIVLSCFILARPYYTKKINEQKHNRDIMLCIDISSSVNDLNLKLVKDLQDVVRSLSGERIGIVMFNTSSVLLSPLSDDYEYTIQQLENIRKAISVVGKTQMYTGSDWAYWQNFLYGGTLVNNYERGSSLIGDGLLGGLFSFPKDSENRTKVIIFATDNDPNGDGYVTLQEAADYCTKKNVTVYGIGTKLMYSSDKEEMKRAVESTGGKFYLEEDAGSFHSIVDEIESKSASLVEGKIITKEVESPERYFKYLVILFVISSLLSLLLRRGNVWFFISETIMIAFLVLIMKFCIIPAHLNQKMPDVNVKKQSKYNVLFVIDDTLSMVANDGREGKERLDNVKEDCAKIIDELDGANFSVVTFNNDAMILAPFNNNSYHAKNVINSIYPIQELYAKGSSLNTPKETVISVLNSTEGKTALFYFGDGEITTDDSLESFAELRDKIDEGAVIGYGTKNGGTMKVKNTWDDSYDEIMDYTTYPFGPAVSRINEANLKKLADDMGIKYFGMNDSGIDNVISKIKPKLDIKEEITKTDNSNTYISVNENNAYFLLIPFILILIFNTIYVIKVK